MKKQQLNSKGFGLIAVVIVIAVLVVLGGTAVYVYHRDHKAKADTSNTTSTSGHNSTQNKSQASSTTSSATPDPYAGWKTYCDSTYHYCFKYSSDWTLTATAATKVGDTGSASLLNPAKTVQVTYSNAYTQDSGAIAFTPSYVNKLTSANEDLTVVGGYSPAGGLQ